MIEKNRDEGHESAAYGVLGVRASLKHRRILCWASGLRGKSHDLYDIPS